MRAAILAATEQLLGERRLDQLPVADILSAAGVSRASFYAYFSSKAAVLVALVEDVVEELLAIWRPWMGGTAPTEEATLRDHIERTVALWRRHRAVLTATVENWRHDPEVEAMWSGTLRRFTDATHWRIERDGLAHGAEAGALAATLTWSTERALYVALAGASRPLRDDAQLVGALTALWTRTLKAA